MAFQVRVFLSEKSSRKRIRESEEFHFDQQTDNLEYIALYYASRKEPSKEKKPTVKKM